MKLLVVDVAMDIGTEYERNRCFDGAVVKSNGPANRNIRHFVRNSYSGLLEDKTEEIKRLHSGTNREIKKDALFSWIATCEREGRALTQQSGADAIRTKISFRSRCTTGLAELNTTKY
jgi:hypothetical protein